MPAQRSLIVERIRTGMRRARLEDWCIGRPTLETDRTAILRDRPHGHSLGRIARTYRTSMTTVHRILNKKTAVQTDAPKGTLKLARLIP